MDSKNYTSIPEMRKKRGRPNTKWEDSIIKSIGLFGKEKHKIEKDGSIVTCNTGKKLPVFEISRL